MKRLALASVLLLTLVRCGSDDSAADNGETGGGTGDAAVGTGGGGGAAGKAGGGGTAGNAGKPDGSTGTGGSAGKPDAGSPATCADAGTPQPAGTPPALTPGQWTDISPPGLNRPRASAPPFGCMDIQLSPCNPYVVYLTTDSEGMWKSMDGGATWKSIGDLATPVSPGVIQIDPANPLNMYYIGGVRGSSMGFWVSTNGGDTWAEPDGFTSQANNSAGGWTNDAYDVKADPADFKHVLVTFHSGFEGTGDAGVIESKDGGNSWVRHWPSGWGNGHSVWFLKDSATWLVGTQYSGYYRTSDSGSSWTKVTNTNMQHGGVGNYYSKTGVLYVGAYRQILRSTDNGLTFTLVGKDTQDGYYAIIGDGNKLYTQLGNTGGNSVGDQPYLVSAEDDGVTWTDYNSQKFADGPYRMAFDPVNRIVYSANWNAGVWALKVQ